MVCSKSVVIFSLYLLLEAVVGFQHAASCVARRWRCNKDILSRGPLLAASVSIPPAPETEKARLVVQLSGPSVTSALFRAELKKELCFFRGCRAYFDPHDAQSNLICEGQTKQIKRFIEWLSALSTDLSERKANFQGCHKICFKMLSYVPHFTHSS